LSFCVLSVSGVAGFAAVAVCGLVLELDAVAPVLAVPAGFAVDGWACWAAAFPKKRREAVRVLSATKKVFRIATIVASAAPSRKASVTVGLACPAMNRYCEIERRRPPINPFNLSKRFQLQQPTEYAVWPSKRKQSSNRFASR